MTKPNPETQLSINDAVKLAERVKRQVHERNALQSVIKTQSVQIKKQKLTIDVLVRIIDELRRPYMDGPQHDLYLLGTDGLNELERLEVLP